MGSVKVVLLAAAAMTVTSAAKAADLPPVMPPPLYQSPPVVKEFAGWYLRGNIGMSNQSVKSLDNVVAPGTTVTTTFLDFDAAPFFGLGAGYQFNWFRLDFTGEFRGKANFHGQQTATFGAIILPDDYKASKSEWLFLANAYLDLGTWWCITPFIGAGIGTSRNTISNFVDIGATQVGATILSTTFGETASKWNFAWAAHAGLAYKVTPGFTVELAYRYVHLGDAKTGPTNSFDGTTVVNGTPFIFKNLNSHDLMLGVRWACCEEPAPAYMPPLIRKG